MTKKTTTKKAPKKNGRPTKFSPDIREKIELLSRRGFTDAEMSKIIGITEQTFNNWKKKHEKFFESLSDWKTKADSEVERSLYERACGYSHPETKAQWVESDVKDEDGWRKVGRWEYAELVRHYPPDSTSMIFWLKNRQPDKWRDIQRMEVSGLDNLGERLAMALERKEKYASS